MAFHKVYQHPDKETNVISIQDLPVPLPVTVPPWVTTRLT